MTDLGHNRPAIDWGWHARDKVIANPQWLDPDNMKAAGLMDRDLVLYLFWTQKLSYKVESTAMAARLAAKLMCEPKSTAHDRLKRLETVGLLIETEKGNGSRPTSYGGNYSSDEYDAIIASACNAIKRAKEKALASGTGTGHNGSSVRPIDRTQTAKQPGHKDSASGADGLVSGEKPVVSGPIDRTTNTKKKEASSKPRPGFDERPPQARDQDGTVVSINRHRGDDPNAALHSRLNDVLRPFGQHGAAKVYRDVGQWHDIENPIEAAQKVVSIAEMYGAQNLMAAWRKTSAPNVKTPGPYFNSVIATLYEEHGKRDIPEREERDLTPAEYRKLNWGTEGA